MALILSLVIGHSSAILILQELFHALTAFLMDA